MGSWGPLGVIPKPFRMESNFEWKAGPKWTQRDAKGPQGTQGNPRGKPFRDEVGTFCPHFFRSPFIQDKTSHSTASTKRSKGGERTTIALQLGITANEWTVFLTILDTVQNWVQTCTFNHPLRAVCLQKRFKTTFWLQEPMLKPPLNFKPTFSRSGPKRSLRRPLRGVGAENGHFRGLAPESF